jgi:hypothetical protein
MHVWQFVSNGLHVSIILTRNSQQTFKGRSRAVPYRFFNFARSIIIVHLIVQSDGTIEETYMLEQLETWTLLELLIGAAVLIGCITIYALHWINKRLAAIYGEIALLRLHFAPDPKHEAEDWGSYERHIEDLKNVLRHS